MTGAARANKMRLAEVEAMRSSGFIAAKTGASGVIFRPGLLSVTEFGL